MKNSPKSPFKLKTRASLIKLLKGSDPSEGRLPCMMIGSPEPGPVAWLTACMHGDEVGGMVVIQEVFKRLRRVLRRGEVHAFPLMNPIGFEVVSRNIPSSREDLNRSFPGRPDGTLGERVADQIFSRICQTGPDLLLDLHNGWKRSVPYVLLDPRTEATAGSTYDAARRICRDSGFYIVEDVDVIRNSLTHNLILSGSPAGTFELGESYVINEKIIEYAVASILQVLAGYDMIPSAPSAAPYPLQPLYPAGQVLGYTERPRCTRSGIIRLLVKPGDPVVAGQPLAKIYNAFGRHQETLHAVSRAFVLATADSAVAFPGMLPVVFGTY